MSTSIQSKHPYVPGQVSQKEHDESVQWLYSVSQTAFSHSCLSTERCPLVLQFQKAVDSLKVDDYIPVFFTEDAEMNFGDAPPMVGRDNLYQRFERQFKLLAGMKHQ